VGTVVTAVAVGKRYSITVTEAGKYGGIGPFDPKLIVGGDSQGTIDPGTPIQFFLTTEGKDFGPFATATFNNGEAGAVVPDDPIVGVSVPDPVLTVTKVVVNNNGGTAQTGDFTLRIDGNVVTSGVVNTVTSGNHTVSEDDPGAGYTSTIGGDCAANGAITLTVGAGRSCTITNDDVESVSGGGAAFDDSDDNTSQGSPTPAPTSPTIGGGEGQTTPTETPVPVPTTVPVEPTPITIVVAPPQLPTATPEPTPAPTPAPTLEATAPAPAPTSESPTAVVPSDIDDTTAGGGGEDGGFPWWGWAIIVLGGGAIIAGAAIYYFRP
jgi:hypothetical protein